MRYCRKTKIAGESRKTFSDDGVDFGYFDVVSVLVHWNLVESYEFG